MIIWYNGVLDEAITGFVATVNPIQFIGLDSAGNIIRRIRLLDIDPHTYSNSTELATITYGGDQDYRFCSGFREDGLACDLASKYSPVRPYIGSLISDVYRFVADRDGWLYCIMRNCDGNVYRLKPGVTREEVLAKNEEYNGLNWDTPQFADLLDYFDTDSYHTYVDFFRIYRENGDRVSIPDIHGMPIRDVATDNNGYFYIVGEPVGESEIYFSKYSRDGTLQWSVELDRYWLILDYDGEPYYGYTFYNVNEHKFRILLSGTDFYISGYWSVRTTSVSPYGTTYFLFDAQVDVNSAFIRKYNSSGVLQWERRFFNPVTNVVTDGTYFYVATKGYYPKNSYYIETTRYFIDSDELPRDIIIFNSSGDVVNSIATPYTIIDGVATTDHEGILNLVYNNGYLYVNCKYSYTIEGQSKLVYIYDTSTLTMQPVVPSYLNYYYGIGSDDLTSINTFKEGDAPQYVFDSNNNQYFMRIYNNTVEYKMRFLAFDSSGNPIWEELTQYDYAEVTYVQVVENPNLPALSLPFSLKRPTWEGDRYNDIPGLSLPISLYIPVFLRDYVGKRLPWRYRVYLTGTPDLELPCQQISIRLNAGYRFISVYCTLSSIEIIDEIDARSSGTLIIKRGVVFVNGSEQLDEMTRASLSNIRYDVGSGSSSISLDGTSEESTILQPKTRVIHGISYRSLTGGIRRIRCEPDTYLAVGDTCNLGGGESMTVGTITITITTNSATMEISEAT